MHSYEKLSIPIQSQTNQEIPIIIQQTLTYLWKSSHKLLSTSFQLSHSLSCEFVKLSREYCAEYPDNITRQICCHCCVLLVPGITSVCAIKSRSKKSPCNRNTKCKIKTQMVTKCNVCKRNQDMVAIYHRKSTTNTTPSVTPQPGTFNANGGSITNSPVAGYIPLNFSNSNTPTRGGVNTNTGFSFLQKSHSSSDLLSTKQNNNDKNTTANDAKKKKNCGNGSNFSFLNMNINSNTLDLKTKLRSTPTLPINKTSPIPNRSSTPVGSFAVISTQPNATTTSLVASSNLSDTSNSNTPVGINLLDLERQQKKLKRKRLSV